MFLGKLIPFHQPGMPLEPERKVEVSFCVYLQQTIKIVIDYFPQQNEADYAPEYLGEWKLDCVGHIQKDEFFVHDDHVEFVVAIHNVRHHPLHNGNLVQEGCIKFYILKLDYDEDQLCLGYTLEHFEEMGLLVRIEPVHCTPSRGL